MRRGRRGSGWGAQLGVDVVVCAPGSVPRAAGDRVKTDRRDAQRLFAAVACRRAVAGAGPVAGRGVVSRPGPRPRGRPRRSAAPSPPAVEVLAAPRASTAGRDARRLVVPWLNWVRRPRFENAAARA